MSCGGRNPCKRHVWDSDGMEGMGYKVDLFISERMELDHVYD